MPEEEMELASKVSGIMSHFPEVWQEYQDWLRDIVSSRTDLLNRHPAWQVSVIFRWRLLYFAVYVAGVVLCDQFLKRLRAFFVGGNVVKARLLSAKAAIAQALAGQLTSRFPSSQGYRYILQRTATLLAVAELTLCGVAALTGVLLAFYYQPAAMGAHESLTRIMHTITNGTLILSLHQVAGHGLIILALVQIVVMFLGREFLLSWLTGWISGILLTLTAIGLSWTAIVLSWEQTSFWRFKVELSIVGSIPLVGATLKEILSGGSGISSITLQHMYAFHSYVLAIAAILLSVIHLTALLFQEQTWKPTEKRFSFAKGCQRAAPNRNAPSA